MADNKTEQSIRRWERARDRVEKAKSELVSANCELANATNDLGRWLSPDDATGGEKFSVWVEGKMLIVEKISSSGLGDFKVEWRKARGKTTGEKPDELAKAATTNAA
jgi:hypothetical protein